jgi:hypothetical protein
MLSRATRRELAPGLLTLVPEVHDHSVLLVVNAFKDKIATASLHALRDLERIARSPEFRAQTFVDRAVASRVGTIAWLVSWWMESAHGSEAWGGIRAMLEADPTHRALRRGYARVFRNLLLRTAPRDPLALRVLARMGADAVPMRVAALAAMVAWTLELWIREGRPPLGR